MGQPEREPDEHEILTRHQTAEALCDWLQKHRGLKGGDMEWCTTVINQINDTHEIKLWRKK